jgi:hypothetical protein
MDVCHTCYNTITFHEPLAFDPVKQRTWCKSCIDRIRVRLIRFLIRRIPLDLVIPTIDTFPSATK